MKPLKSPRVIPETRQYWSHTLEGKGEHHFKHPYYGVAGGVLAFAASFHVDPEADTRSTQDAVVAMLPGAGAVLGACWFHRELVLDAVYPLAAPTHEALVAYGTAVAMELQDADYDLLEIISLFGPAMTEFAQRQSLVEMASNRASFTAPPKEGSTSSSLS